MSQKSILFGCLDKSGQDKYLKLSHQSQILFWSLFDTRNIASPPSRYQVSVAKTLSPPRHSFFYSWRRFFFHNSFKKKVLIISKPVHWFAMHRLRNSVLWREQFIVTAISTNFNITFLVQFLVTLLGLQLY